MRLDFPHLLPIYQAMQPVRGSVFSVVVSAEIRKTLVMILEDEDAVAESGFSYSGELSAIVEGSAIEMRVGPPRVGMGILANSLEDYLSKQGVVLKEKNHFFLRDSSFYSKDKVVPCEVGKYRSLLRFITLLKESAHYLDEKAESLVFYKEGRFDVFVKYGYREVVNFDCPTLDDIHEFMAGQLHKEQKKSVLAETVIELTQALEPSERFVFLIQNIKELLRNCQIGYSLFAKDFTYEKAKEEMYGFKLDITARLHKIISEIQAPLLGIPIATFIALSQMKKTDHLDAQFAVNVVIFLGVVIFCILLGGLLVNQNLTLHAIEADVKRQNAVFSKRFEDAPDTYTEVFKSICSRLTFQYFAIYLILVLTVLIAVISVVFFIVHTRPFYNALFS